MEKIGKRIESKTSRTAEFNCMFRAASYYEKLPQYKSDDYIAPKLLPKFFMPVVKIGVFRSLFNRFFPPGMYEYVIARTKFIDSIFKNAISSEFDQILIFGAGFDSRGIRFADLNKKTKHSKSKVSMFAKQSFATAKNEIFRMPQNSTNFVRIFELDMPITQEAKINQLKKGGIKINPSIVFISVDFNKESVEDKLLESGFRKDKKSLFILEGLLYYLSSQAVDNTFNVIDRLAGNESEVVFDYIYASVLREENLYYGESEVFNGVKKENEPWRFGIEKGEIESFLKDRNLKLIRNLNSEDLENEFFKDEQGNIIAKVNGARCIAYARK